MLKLELVDAQERRSLCTTALYFWCCVAVCVCGKDDRKEAAQAFTLQQMAPDATHTRETRPLRAARHDA